MTITDPAIHEELLGQCSSFSTRADELYRLLDADQLYVDADEAIDPREMIDLLPLESTERRQLVLVLATGGPHIEVVAPLWQDGTPHDARIVGRWGSDRVELTLSPNAGLSRLVAEFAELMAL